MLATVAMVYTRQLLRDAVRSIPVAVNDIRKAAAVDPQTRSEIE